MTLKLSSKQVLIGKRGICMKKRSSFIKIPAIIKSGGDKPKKSLFSFVKKIKLPKFGIKYSRRSKLEESIVASDMTEVSQEIAATPAKSSGRVKRTKSKKPFKFNFNVAKAFTGIRGRIILLVAIITIIPLLGQTYISVKTQTDTVTGNLTKLSQAINQGLVERIDATLKQSIATLELIPKSIDILAYDRLEQERIMRKLMDQNFKDVYILDLNGIVTACTDSKERDKDFSTEDWFKQSVAGNRFISGAKNETKYKGPVIRIAAPLLDENFRPKGVIVAVLAMDKMQEILKEQNHDSDSLAYIIDKSGTVLGHPEFKEKVMNGYNAVENKIEGAIEISNGKSGTHSYKNDQGKMVVGTYSIIPTTNWGLITEIEESKAMLEVQKVKASGVVNVFVAIAISIAGSLVLAWAITKPLVRMARVVSEIKDGNFSKRLEVTSKDEIGELQNAFNLMTESLCQILFDVDTAVNEISVTSNKLSDSSQITSSATDEITAIVEDVAEGAQSQIQTVRSTLDVARAIANSVVSTSEKTQRVSVSAKEAAQVAKSGSENISIISEKIGGIKDNVVNSAELVGKLGEKSAEVTGIVKVIRDIAGKTNMLALNAAIEAARAGEAGRGFAVVANEIRNLADQTKEASKNIETLLLEIQKETELTVEAMNEGLIEVEQGTSAISATYSTFNKIIEEIHIVADEIHLVSDSVLELKSESERISKAVEEVNDIAESTSMGTQSVLASTEEQSSAMQEINDSAANLSKMAGELKTKLQRFKI